MESPPASATVCSACGEPLSASGGCVPCLLRAGLDDAQEDGSPPSSLVFGDFEIARRADGSLWELGRGAMGVTYRAVDKVLHRDVALKVIQTPPAADGSRAVRERFLREARAAAALRHSNVAGVFHLSASPGVDHCYFAMELVEGETLEVRVRRQGPLKVELALEIAIQVTRALMAAAARGLIHRDLKPGNIMLARGDADELEVKVIDFGLAKAAAEAAGEMDLTHGGFVGTPAFASPEQFESGAIDARSDIYALGATLWFALTGRVPFSATTIEEMRSSRTRKTLPIEQLVAKKVPPAVIKLLRCCLAIDPAERPSSARELMESLEFCHARIARLPARKSAPTRKLLAIMALIAIAAAAVFAVRVFQQRRSTLAANESTPASVSSLATTPKSIAVLPLENLSADQENAFFADGIQDDILTSLAKISDLKVISRTSVSLYRGAGAIRNLRDIARELGVENILEGSVRREGNRVLVAVQLIDARNDRHLWAERYDRTLADSIGLQGEVAAEIAAALRAKLAPEEKASLEARPTDNPEAYALYLKARGREGAVNHSTADLMAAEQLYTQAITLDPRFALAYARLSIAQSRLGYETTDDRKARARAAADEALRLAPTLSEAHTALALCMYWGDKDYAAALEEFSVAATTSPNEPDILNYIAGIQRRQGRWRESLATYQRAQDLDPRNRQIIVLAAIDHLLVRDWPGARARYNRALEIAPDSAHARVWLAYLEVFQNSNPAAGRKILENIPAGIDPDGMVTGARWDLAMMERDYASAEKILTDSPLKDFPKAGDAPKTYCQGRLDLARGDIEAAQRYFAAATPDIEKWVRDDPNDPNRVAQLGLLYAYMDRKKDAIREGRRAVELEPESQNAFHGAVAAANLALVYALIGEQEQAITLIERLLSTPGLIGSPDSPYNITLADLRLRWEWDSLRNNPRFQKILAGPEPKTVLTPIPQTAPPAPEKSIAVLPFENLSNDEANANFAAGVQDELLSDLAKIADLKVISRSSVMRYKNSTESNLRDIGQALGVTHIVEGSVQRVGNRVRVNAQLVDTRTDAHLWAQTYEGELVDIFGIQSEIAQRIADQLRAKISPTERAAILEQPTTDLTAYALYTEAKAASAWADWKKEPVKPRILELLREAIRRDPNFVLAYCFLAEVYSHEHGNAGRNGYESPEVDELWKQAVDTAMRLRPDLGEPHVALARYHFFLSHFDAARDELAIARRLLPNNSDAIYIAARIDRRQNRWEESLAGVRKAHQLDPRNPDIIGWTCDMYRFMRRYREGEQFVSEAMARMPEITSLFNLQLAIFKLNEGDLRAAQEILAQVPQAAGGDVRFQTAFYLRDYDTAAKVIATTPAEDAEGAFDGKPPRSFADGQLARARGDNAAAQAAFLGARKNWEDPTAHHRRDEAYFTELALLDAGLGRKQEAIREAQHAVELLPISQDALFGPQMVRNLAWVYAWTGEPNLAIEKLEMLSKIPSELSYGDLHFNPCWDSLRGDPRFEKVIAALASNITPIPSTVPEKSIAVLPFENLSSDEANASFAAGVQDELLSDLARIADLKVISRSSVMKYKNSADRNLRDIGQALGVSHIVEGSVQRIGNHVRVNAQLVDTRTDAHLWAQTYDGELADVFGIQSEIAQRIADQLRAKISPAEKAAILEQPTTDLTAYALYTEAKAAKAWADWKKERIKPRLFELLHEAIRRDPNFVLAYCFLAEVYSFDHAEAVFTGHESGPVDELWKQTIDNAMRLRPDLGEPHLALARYHLFLNHFDAARDEVAIARRLLPNNAEAIFIAARIDRRQNRWEESLASVRKAYELDPRDPEIITWTCEIYWLMRRYREGEQFVSEAMARTPEITSWLNVQRAEFKLREGDPRAAQENLAQKPQDAGGAETRFRTALYLRDYDTAARVIASTPADRVEEAFHGKPPRSLGDGQLARARGDNAAAQAAFLGAREDWENPTAHRRRDEWYFTEVALLDAGLGRKQEAIREAQHAVELLPFSQDALFGPLMVRNLAWVYAWTGEPNLAIEKLEMLSKIPTDVSYGDLHLNPCWDSLRGDPRFEKIVTSLKPNAMTK